MRLCIRHHPSGLRMTTAKHGQLHPQQLGEELPCWGGEVGAGLAALPGRAGAC